jgi:hypothetical protein
VEPILNELSIEPVDGTSTEERLLALAEVFKAVRLLGAARVLRSTRDAVDRWISPNESLRAALYADRGHREARQLLRSALHKAPFVDTLQERAEQATGRLVEVRHGERPAPGLGMALLLRSTAVSLVGVADFAVSDVPVSHSVLVDTGELQTSDEHVLNVWSLSSVERSRPQITERVIAAVASGEHAWGRRHDLFSHLEWSREAQAQLRSLAGSELAFHSVVERLVKVNQYTATWSGGPFEPPVKFSVEGEGTLQHGKLGVERECTLSTGEIKRLSLHIKLTDYWRIYFEFRQIIEDAPEEHPRAQVLIGYIGKHLRLG